MASLGGRIGWTVKLLSRATLAACDAGEDRLDLGRLAEAWAEFDYSDDVGGEPAADYTDERAFEAAVSSGSRLSRDANPFLCDGKRLVPLLGELLRRVDIERRQLAEVMGRSAAINDDEAVTTRGLPRGRDTGLRAAGGGRRLLGRAK